MSNFSKAVIIIILILSFFFIKEKWGVQISDLISSAGVSWKIELPSLKTDKKQRGEETVKKPAEILKKKEEKTKNTVSVYFLALDSDNNSIYNKVERELPSGAGKLEYALQELLKGPNIIEKSTGAYSEIPKNVKLLKVKQIGNKIIIDFSSDFQIGGGTDSIYSRMMQLIKTALANSENKQIYLYLDGKQINFIGGEGIMINQPLSEKSPEV